MNLVQLLIAILVVALVFWLLQHYVVPALPAPWGNFVLAIFALVVIIWILGLFGLLGPLTNIRIG